MKGLNYKEKKGEVTFFSGEKGDLWQQIGIGRPFPVGNELAHIGSKNGFEIKYHTNGVSGYCVCKEGLIVKMGYWTLKEADQQII